MERPNVFVLELEGLLSPTPSLSRLCELLSGGARIYDSLARYDQLCNQEGAEPGQVYAFLLPFLIYHRITQEAIAQASQAQSVASAVTELLTWLRERQWEVLCITSAYDHYAHPVTERLGLPRSRVAATRLPLARFQNFLRFAGEADLEKVPAIEAKLLTWEPTGDDMRMKGLLDNFFHRGLPGSPLGGMLQSLKPLVGQRKTEALEGFAHATDYKLGEMFAVGSSPADGPMLAAVDRAGGLAVTLNAEVQHLQSPSAPFSVSSVSALLPLLEKWEERRGRGEGKYQRG